MLGNTHTCSVCLTRVTVDQLNGVSCGHMFCGDCWDVYCQVQIQQGITTGKIKHILLGDLRFSGSIIRRSRFIFTKERRTIRQKSGWLNHSNERIFQVYLQMEGRIMDSWKWGPYV